MEDLIFFFDSSLSKAKELGEGFVGIWSSVIFFMVLVLGTLVVIICVFILVVVCYIILIMFGLLFDDFGVWKFLKLLFLPLVRLGNCAFGDIEQKEDNVVKRQYGAGRNNDEGESQPLISS